MNRDVEGLQPVAGDVHSAREAGFNHIVRKKNKDGTITEASLQQMLRKAWPDNVDVEAMQDDGPTITEQQYEWVNEYFNALTDYLNKTKWLNKTNWKPKQIQAIGWMRIQKHLAMVVKDYEAPETTLSAINQNIRQVSTEIDPGEGSPWAKKFGKRWSALPDESKRAVTHAIQSQAVQIIEQEYGVKNVRSTTSVGAWLGGFNPASTQHYVLMTRETGREAAHAIAFLTNQTEVFINRALRSGNKKGILFSGDAFALTSLTESFWLELSRTGWIA